MRLLVIGNDLVAQTIASMYDGVLAPCEQGIKTFLETEPDVVVITGYEEKANQAAVQAWKDIKNTADEEKIIRIGLARYEYPDYYQLPFKSTALIDFLDHVCRA